MTIGLFFGSFNPIHIGHTIIAEKMLENAGIDELWFIVSPQNPFKKNKSLLHEFDRLNMVKVAISENSKFKVSDIEFNMPKPNYTIDTLTFLSEKYPETKFKLIIGEDNLASFKKWKNYVQVLENYGLLVYPRYNIKKTDFIQHLNIKMINAPLIDISATFIRNAIKENQSIKYLVNESVEAFIERERFYL